jgi:hypothetical protein
MKIVKLDLCLLLWYYSIPSLVRCFLSLHPLVIFFVKICLFIVPLPPLFFHLASLLELNLHSSIPLSTAYFPHLWALHSLFPTPEFHMYFIFSSNIAPDCQLPTPNSQLLILDSLLSTHDSQLPTFSSHFPTLDSPLPYPNFPLCHAYSIFFSNLAPNSCLPISGLSTPFSQLLNFTCISSSLQTLLPTPDSRLPTPNSQLPTLDS